ncbi:MAG: hypothetical protein ACJAVX_001622 [Pseudoalteromonas rhizosphaerae]|jgi:hypothetical protein
MPFLIVNVNKNLTYQEKLLLYNEHQFAALAQLIPLL